MAEQVIEPRIRGFISLTTHPEGCAANVREQVALVKEKCPGEGLGNVLVLGSSTGYGLSSLLAAVFGYKSNCLGVCFEKPGEEKRPGTAGWNNLAEAHRLAKEDGLHLETINADAFSNETRAQVIAALKERYGKLDMVVYSLASPKRKDPNSDTIWSSVLKPIGEDFFGKTVNLRNEEVEEVVIEKATDQEVAETVRVMGGEDWQLWMDLLIEADLLAEGCRSVAYSYIGPAVTKPLYRFGSIGAAKKHLEETAKNINGQLQTHCAGNAWVSVNKALVTQASAAIPVVTLYIGVLFKIMKEAGTHEGCMDQIIRLFVDHLGPGKTPVVDEDGLIRVDELELDDAIQAKVDEVWPQINTANLRTIADFDGFQEEFRRLFGFGIDGVDYSKPVETVRDLI